MPVSLCQFIKVGVTFCQVSPKVQHSGLSYIELGITQHTGEEVEITSEPEWMFTSDQLR